MLLLPPNVCSNFLLDTILINAWKSCDTLQLLDIDGALIRKACKLHDLLAMHSSMAVEARSVDAYERLPAQFGEEARMPRLTPAFLNQQPRHMNIPTTMHCLISAISSPLMNHLPSTKVSINLDRNPEPDNLRARLKHST